MTFVTLSFAVVTSLFLVLGATEEPTTRLEWAPYPDLPPDPGARFQIGRAGMCAGASQDHLIALGGTNFPEPGRTATRGGVKTYHDTGWILGPEMEQWTWMGEVLPVPSDQALAVPYQDGFFCIGGTGSTTRRDGDPLASVLFVELVDGEISVERYPDLPAPASKPVGGLHDGALIVADDRHVFKLDLSAAAPAWQRIAVLPWDPRQNFSGVIFNGGLHIMGGRTRADKDWHFYDDHLRYDLDGGGWREEGSLPLPLSFATLCEFGDTLYLMDGADPEYFRLEQDLVAELSAVPEGTNAHGRWVDELSHLFDHHIGFHAAVYQYIDGRWRESGWYAGTPAIKHTAVPWNGGAVFIGGEVAAGKRTRAVWFIKEAGH